MPAMTHFLHGFGDELTKIGSTPNVLKQYRRARKIIEGRKSAFHGTRGTKPILEAGKIAPSPAGRHGPGVYTWRETPVAPYFNKSRPEGFVMGLDRVERGSVRQLKDAATGGAADRTRAKQVALFRGEGGKGSEHLALKAKDTAVVQPSAALEAGRRAHHVRHIHPEIFQRAQADIRAKGLARGGKANFDPEDVVGPSVSELKKLMHGKTTTPKLRRETTEFLEDYEKLV